MATTRTPRQRFLLRVRRPSVTYSALVVIGAVLVIAGVGLVFVPAALMLAGLAVFVVGWVGLGVPPR